MATLVQLASFPLLHTIFSSCCHQKNLPQKIISLVIQINHIIFHASFCLCLNRPNGCINLLLIFIWAIVPSYLYFYINYLIPIRFQCIICFHPQFTQVHTLLNQLHSSYSNFFHPPLCSKMSQQMLPRKCM